MNQQFYEGEELLGEITDSHLVVHRRGHTHEYRLDRITHQFIASHESGSDHNVFFGLHGDPDETTVAVVWADRESAERFRDDVVTALPPR